ncbi:MAG: murein hydrolase activator EnvC family protein [Alphaproteobacteria bacterium]
MRRRNPAKAGALVAALFAALTPAVLSAQNDAPEARLESVTLEIAASEAERARLEKEADAVRREARALQKNLVDAAAQLRDQEEKITALEADLQALRAREATAVGTLELQAGQLSDSLAAMQMLSRQPSATLLLRPASIPDTARTAILLDHLRGHLTREADALREQVRVVQALQISIEEEQTTLREGMAALAAGQERLAGLVADRKARQASLGQQITEQQARQQALAEEAESLEALIKKIEEEAAARDRFAGTGEPLDTVPFSTAKGSLPLPAAGAIVRTFGQPGRGGRPSRGVYMETRPQGQVSAPWDGRVVFAGPFRDYGLLLIIDHGEGYHSLLAGMSVVDVVASQWVLAGEPIGQMGKNVTGAADNAKPRLYIELRQDGRSINPLPWLAEADRKVRG